MARHPNLLACAQLSAARSAEEFEVAVSTDVEAAGERRRGGDGTSEQHTSDQVTSDEVRAATRDGMPAVELLDELVDYAVDGVFLRFSRGPSADADSVSRDHESGLELPGLSVVPLGPQPWWQRPVEDWISRQVCKYLHLREQADDDRFAWLLRGEVVGRGPDDEPLVEQVEPLVWLAETLLNEARRCYAQRFDVGRDST